MVVLNKLKSNDFKCLRENGRTFKTPNFLFVYKLSEESLERENLLNFGFTITRKVGNAVLRNRLRRLLRESLRTYVTTEIAEKTRENKIKLDLNIVVLQKQPNKTLVCSNVHKQIQHFFDSRVFG